MDATLTTNWTAPPFTLGKLPIRPNKDLRQGHLAYVLTWRCPVKLFHGSLIYRDKRLEGFDAATLVEVIEHLDPPRLASLERVVFEFARPKTVVLTTPNREYNVMWETLPAGQLRHSDHRFEWTRQEFQEWADRVAEQYGYAVRFLPVGPEDEQVGSPTQMGVFERMKAEARKESGAGLEGAEERT